MNEQEVETNDIAVDPETVLAEAHLGVDGVADDKASRIETLEHELAATKQEVLYAQAETQNVRRRMEKDATDARTYAATNFARDILSVADNLSRGARGHSHRSARGRQVQGAGGWT